jgi:hypothetical protein
MVLLALNFTRSKTLARILTVWRTVPHLNLCYEHYERLVEPRDQDLFEAAGNSYLVTGKPVTYCK